MKLRIGYRLLFTVATLVWADAASRGATLVINQSATPSGSTELLTIGTSTFMMHTPSFPQFDPALGTLNSAILEYDIGGTVNLTTSPFAPIPFNRGFVRFNYNGEDQTINYDTDDSTILNFTGPDGSANLSLPLVTGLGNFSFSQFTGEYNLDQGTFPGGANGNATLDFTLTYDYDGIPTSGTLSELFAGQSILAGDKLFSNWNLMDRSPEVHNGAVVDLSQIEVTALTDDPFNPGIKFTAPEGTLGTPSSHDGLSSASLHFSYTVETTNGQPLIKDNSLLLNDFLFDAGFEASIRIQETISNIDQVSLGGKEVLAVPGDTPNSGNPNHFDSAIFAQQSALVVETLIVIEGPGDNDFASLRMFEQRFSQVPESSACTFAVLGVIGLFAHARRRTI